jgi:site-specific recombinase XerD
MAKEKLGGRASRTATLFCGWRRRWASPRNLAGQDYTPQRMEWGLTSYRGQLLNTWLSSGVVAKGSPIQANRVQALLSKVFSFALDAELVTTNPCARLKKRSKETTATRVLSDNEIRLFWRRVGDPPNSKRMGQGLRLVMLTGVRVTELAGAEIKEFERLDDAKNAIGRFPRRARKMGKRTSSR